MSISTMKSIAVKQEKTAKARRIANRAFGTLRTSYDFSYRD